jgi:deazaflavin-dependent oxidoreductase (nitroreductase family)
MLFGDEHVRRYRETGGEVGYHWNDVTTLILETTGRHSGKLRAKALISGQDGDRYVVVASKGGHPRHPAWFHNLRAHPDTTVQVGSELREVRARVARPDERRRLWPRAVKTWPGYEGYQRRTKREIPLVILEPRMPARSSG